MLSAVEDGEYDTDSSQPSTALMMSSTPAWVKEVSHSTPINSQFIGQLPSLAAAIHLTTSFFFHIWKCVDVSVQ